ncbi:ferredoxin [Amycolatopsis sp. NPDC005232]|uniref:ferredoxin n=1 Tax=Amycolatopsis sp. NPDC005232 TaxID=3157027 RepID=UPI0033B02506
MTTCAGVAQCVQAAPGAFQLDDDLLSVFEPSGPWNARELEATRDNWPMSAIRIDRTDATPDS